MRCGASAMLGEVGRDNLADQPIVGATSRLFLDSFHHLAHVGPGSGADFGNDGFDDLFDLSLR